MSATCGAGCTYLGATGTEILTSYFETMYDEIATKILQESVLHVDETTVNLRGGRGYVWVLTTMDKVYYFYRASREGSFLKEMLAPFKGMCAATMDRRSATALKAWPGSGCARRICGRTGFPDL